MIKILRPGIGDPGSSLDANQRILDRLLDSTEMEISAGSLGKAALQAQLAATFAWFNHGGIFVSERLERALQRISVALPGQDALERSPSVPPERILHIATQVYATGGHTQMIAKWLELDRKREHRVCLTAQGTAPIATKITEQLGDRRLILLDRRNHDILSRSIALRDEARWADRIILHVHPNDVVAPIALSGVPTAPVILVNHADHVFWVGALTADLVMNLRRSGADLSIRRRGVEPSRSLICNRPLRLSGRTVARADAKRLLGVPPSKVLIVTAAAGSKYEAIGRTGFVDLIASTLRRNPDAFLLAAGPNPTGRWAELALQNLGRALGEIPDVSVLMQAADIYVDSFPFASLTSMLEAANYGVPVVSYRTEAAQSAVLGADTPELDDVMFAPSGVEDLDKIITALIADQVGREKRGLETLSKVQAAHGNGAWQRSLDSLYRSASELATSEPELTENTTRMTSELDERVRVLQAQTGHGAGLIGVRAIHLALLPLKQRTSAWWRARGYSSKSGLGQLLSARQRMTLESMRSSEKSKRLGPMR